MMKYILILLLFVSGSVFAQYPGPYYPQGSNYEYRGKIKFNAPTWFLDSALFNGYTRVVTMGSSDSSRAAASTAFVKNQTSASTWKLFGNYTPIDPTQYRLGFLDSTPLIIINNGDTSLVVPAAGVNRASSARHKFLTIDTLNKNIYYTDGGAGGAIDTSNKWVNAIYRKAGKDSIFFNIGGTEYKIKDSTGGGGGTDDLEDVTGRDSITTHSMLVRGNNKYIGLESLVAFGGALLTHNETVGGNLYLAKPSGAASTIDVSALTGSRAHSLPDASGTFIISADTSVFSRKQMPAYSIRANNTNAAADATNFTYKSFLDLAYADTAVWTFATTKPSGTPVIRYSWSQINKDVKITMTCYYPTAGSSVTAATFVLPTDMPAPKEPTGTGAADDVLYPGTGFITTNYATEPTISGRAFMKVNSADTGYEFKVVSSSVSARYAVFTINYTAL